VDIVDSNLKFVKGPEQRRLLKVEYEIALMKEENPPTERAKLSDIKFSIEEGS